MDFTSRRQTMVEEQLITRGITDQRVLDAFRKVPRERFLPPHLQLAAYDDCALPIGESQTISQPYMVAVMTEALMLKGNETVLEVGTGSGYQAAILAELCRKVYTIERIEKLSHHARQVLEELGYINNVEFVTGDGTEGYPKAAPYGGIIVTAGCPTIPEPLIAQLKEKGRLILPVGDHFQQVLTTVYKLGEEVLTEESIPCVFVPLVGKYGW